MRSEGQLLSVGLDSVAELFRGHVDVDFTNGGIIPVRLAEVGLLQAPDDLTREVFRMASGVRLAFTTCSTKIEADVSVWRTTVDEARRSSRTPPPVSFVTRVDGFDVGDQQITELSERIFESHYDGARLSREVRCPPTTIRARLAGAAEKSVELWFPANATVEVAGLRANAPLRKLETSQLRWVHYGSSISHCMEARRPTETWPAVTARLAEVELLNLAVAGACHLDQFVARTIRDAKADLISLKIGINIAGDVALTHRTFGPALHGFLDTVREGHPRTPILVISPIICPMLENQAGPIAVDVAGRLTVKAASRERSRGLSLRMIRQIMAEIVETRARSDENVAYLDGLALFGADDVPDLPDGLHPDARGYIRIGERFARAAFYPAGFFGKQVAAPPQP